MTTVIRQSWDWLCFAFFGAYLLLVWWWMLLTRRLDAKVSWWQVCGGLFIGMGQGFRRTMLALLSGGQRLARALWPWRRLSALNRSS